MLVSLLCGVLVFFLSYGLQGRRMPALVPPGEGFVELILDASYPDRQIRDMLAREGLTTVIGESSQWVFLDDFGKLERIPLDLYGERVEPFDPRNDGYAEELRSFFVQKGKRRIFIGLKGAPLDLEGRIRAALGDISLAAHTPRRSPLAPALLFIAAAALTLLVSREILVTLFFLPLWAPLAGFGAPGFALMSVLAGLARVLREPAREYFVSRRHGTAGGKARRSPVLWVLSCLFLAAAALLAVFGRFPPLTVPGALICVPLILYVSLRTESCRGVQAGHIRFTPVQITPLARRPGAYSPSMVPFAVAALALQFLPLIVPGAAGNLPRGGSGWKSSPELNEERYRKHLAFQQAFSYTSLSAGESPYLRYSLAGDGLIDGNGSGEAVFAEPEAIPPFSLAPLMDFLDTYAYTSSSPVASEGGVCPFILLGLWIPLFLRDRRGRRMWGKLSIYIDKRIAA
jgi:hypothetical protein